MIHGVIKSALTEDISLLLNIDNHPWQYICDCGQASGFTVKEYQNTRAIFISHMHIDHFIGWDQIMRHQVGIQRTVSICGPRGIAKQIQAKIKAYTWNLIEENAITYEIREIVAEQLVQVYLLQPKDWALVRQADILSSEIYQEPNFKVQFTILDHKTDSIAYRFDEQDTIKIDLNGSGFQGGAWIQTLKNAFAQSTPEVSLKIGQQVYKAGDLFHLLSIKKGNALGVIMDHAANSSNHQKIGQLFSHCDTVFIESFFQAADIELAKAHFHSYSTASGQLMRAIGVKKAIPMHFSRKYTEEDIQVLIQEFDEAFEQLP